MPALLAGIIAIGSLVGWVVGVAKTVSNMKATQKHLAEHERHNRTMEARGKGLYFKPYKGGGGEQPKKKK